MVQPARNMLRSDGRIEYNVALYMRLSRDDGDLSESESIINQRKILHSFAMEQGFNVVGEYVDDGWSGTNFNRPGFQQMIKDIDPKKINCVVTKDLSRLGRDHVMMGYYIETFFPENNIRYIAINDKVDSDQGDNDITPFMNVFNEFHAKQTRKKVRSVFEAKFKEGECHYAFPPMGYNKDPNRKNHLVPDPETDWIIKKMFELAEEGMGPWAIRGWLFDHKIITPGYRAYLRWGSYAKTYENAPEERRYEWGLANVKKILKDPIYIGTLVHYRKRTISFKNHKAKKQPPSKQMVSEDAHEGLVTEEQFNHVQELIEVRRRKTKAGSPHMFAGIAVCADCGGYMRFGANRTSPSHEYRYLCCGRKSEIGTRSCTAHHTQYDQFCQVILEKIQELYRLVKIDKESIVSKLSVKVNEQAIMQKANNEEERKKLQTRKDELGKIIAKLYEDLVSGRVTDEMFSMMSERFRGEHAEVSQRLIELSGEESEPAISESQVQKLVDLVDEISYPTELTTELINLLIEKIEIHEPVGRKHSRNKTQRIEIHWRFVEPTRPDVVFK